MTVYFADLAEGDTYRSQSRTLRESDIVTFTDLSGDHNPLHTDDEWVRSNTSYDGRIAHGLLVLAMSSGLPTAGLDDWAILAYLNVERQMVGPAYPGDAVYQRSSVESLRPSRSRPGAGVVVVHAQVFNQHDQLLQEGRDTYLVGGKEAMS